MPKCALTFGQTAHARVHFVFLLWVFRTMDLQEVPEAYFDASCRLIIQTVLFNRALGQLLPKICEIESLGLRFCAIPDDGLQALVDGFLAALRTSMVEIGPNIRRARFAVSFYKHVSRGSFLGISTGTDKREWERWQISVISNNGEFLPPVAVASSPGEGTHSSGGERWLPGALPSLPTDLAGTAPSSSTTVLRTEPSAAARASAPDTRVGDGSEVAAASTSGPAFAPDHASAASSGADSVASCRSMAARQAVALRETLETAVLQIAAMASERTAHVPPIEFDSRFSLFYKFTLLASEPPSPAITKPGAAETARHPAGTRWLGDMANLLKNGPPMMLRGGLGTS